MGEQSGGSPLARFIPSKDRFEWIRWELSSFLLSCSSVLSRTVVGVGSYAAATATDIYPQFST